MERLTLKKLYSTNFQKLYWKLLTNSEDLSVDEYKQVLAIGIFFIGLDNAIFKEFGYRLFLLYSKKTKDYKPLYELSLNKGLIPVAQFIDEKLDYAGKYGNIWTTINSIINGGFRNHDTYKTIGQCSLFEKANELMNCSQIIVAPTSYGKTELILSLIEGNPEKNICIISPTKALLAQTKKRILNQLGNYKKIVTQPEMYLNDEKAILAVLTQERLLRLLQKNPTIKMDLLIIDEAHNLLEGFSKNNMRSVILASAIIICHHRNRNMVCKYLTPVLKSRESLSLKYINNQCEFYSVSENIKSEMYYFYDLQERSVHIIDQHSGSSEKLVPMTVRCPETDVEVVLSCSSEKNLIYLNSPRALENFSSELSSRIRSGKKERLEKAARDLREFVHENYKLADYIRKGVVYHHGSVPEPVRYYIEDLYNSVSELNMLVANSTLLEGVNFPSTKMFILDTRRGNKYFSPASFKNLVGRICRLGEIFNLQNGKLDYLLPEIHIVKGKYCRSNFNIINFFKTIKAFIIDAENIEDDIQNPLLVNTVAENDKINKAEEILENISSAHIVTENINTPKTLIGKLCFENNINIFNIFEKENEMNYELNSISRIKDVNELFVNMNRLFFSKIDNTEGGFNNFKRLRENEAQKFYKMLIDWRLHNIEMRRMVDDMVRYWKSLKGEQAKNVYVGKWGEHNREGHQKYWIDITSKTDSEKVNLAIVRLKEEYDFIDNEIIKYVEVLNSLDLLEEELYLKMKYGTSDKNKIFLLNCGISIKLANLLFSEYKSYFKIDMTEGMIKFSPRLIEQMEKNNENGIYISEVKMNAIDS